MWRKVTSDVKHRKLSGSYTKIKTFFSWLGSTRIFIGFGSTKIRLDSAQLFAFAAPASAYKSNTDAAAGRSNDRGRSQLFTSYLILLWNQWRSQGF